MAAVAAAQIEGRQLADSRAVAAAEEACAASSDADRQREAAVQIGAELRTARAQCEAELAKAMQVGLPLVRSQTGRYTPIKKGHLPERLGASWIENRAVRLE